jgi:GntR family transcriptional regulator
VTVGLRVDPSDPTPPYEQLRRQLVTLIGAGTLAEGTRLPPVRQLAADLALATGTVARTYRELERSGLIRSRRGAGTTVTAAAPVLSSAARRDRVGSLLDAAVQQARLMGADDHEIQHALDEALARSGTAAAANP